MLIDKSCYVIKDIIVEIACSLCDTNSCLIQSALATREARLTLQQFAVPWKQ